MTDEEYLKDLNKRLETLDDVQMEYYRQLQKTMKLIPWLAVSCFIVLCIMLFYYATK